MEHATEAPPQPKTEGRRRARSSSKIVLIGIVLFAVALWGIYWYGATQIGAAVLDRVAAAAAAGGYTSECEDIAGGGFPLSIGLSCSRASFADTAGGLYAAVDGLSVRTSLYRPWHVRSAAAGPLVVSLPASKSDLTARWKKAETRLDAGLGGVSGIAAKLEGLRLSLPPGPEPSQFVALTLARADFAVAPESNRNYRMSAVARALVLETGNGGNLPDIDLDANLIAVDFGDALGLDPRQALSAWIAGGASVRIDDLTIVADIVSAKSSGALALSSDGKLSGDLDVTITGLEALPDLVESFHPEARARTEQIVAAVTAFTRPVDLPTGPARQMTLLVRDSVVSIGILPIGVIPTIAF